jgi:hypothetical protein
VGAVAGAVAVTVVVEALINGLVEAVIEDPERVALRIGSSVLCHRTWTERASTIPIGPAKVVVPLKDPDLQSCTVTVVPVVTSSDWQE